ncbi:MAG: hypothetical protein MJY73_07760 [Bacteroidales bacterium]|nr:hypothetical protein [Bacteroidales bacterium]
MERMKVITVPSTDLDNPGGLHTAFSVYSESAGALRASAGWTLKDAIEFYARDNGVLRDRIRLQRPFERQEDYLRRHGIYM